MDSLRLFGAMGAGAAFMYFLDPNTGGRRRALVRDQVVHAAHKTGDAVDATSRDLSNRARGVVADLRGRLDGDDVSDTTLQERVRARIGAVVGHASALQATVSDGLVTLSGPILADDVDRLLRRVRAVRGVRGVDDRLEVHAEPNGVPALQGRPRRRRGGEVFELWQDHWSPTARLLTGAAGAALIVGGLRRLDNMGFSVAALGLGLLSRASTNVPLARTAESFGAWRHAER
jgi:hypothetical protein